MNVILKFKTLARMLITFRYGIVTRKVTRKLEMGITKSYKFLTWKWSILGS